MLQIWTLWLQVKRIQSGAPDYNSIPATAHRTLLLEHQPNLFKSTLIRRYCRQLDFYTGEDNRMGGECPVRDSGSDETVKITYRLQACSEPVRREGYYCELTVPGIRPLSPHYRLIRVSLSGGSPIICGNTRTPLLTPRWPCRCLPCWKNANLSGVPPGCSAYCSSAVSPDMVPLFRLSCPKAGMKASCPGCH